MARVSILMAMLLGACGGSSSGGGKGGFSASIGGGPDNTIVPRMHTAIFLLQCASNAPNRCQFTASDIEGTGCPHFELDANGVPATGTTYNLVDRTNIAKDVRLSQDTLPLDANLVYTEVHGGSCTSSDTSTVYEWVSSGGTVQVDSVADGEVAISFSDVPMIPDNEAVTSMQASGSFTLTGSGTTTTASGL